MSNTRRLGSIWICFQFLFIQSKQFLLTFFVVTVIFVLFYLYLIGLLILLQLSVTIIGLAL